MDEGRLAVAHFRLDDVGQDEIQQIVASELTGGWDPEASDQGAQRIVWFGVRIDFRVP